MELDVAAPAGAPAQLVREGPVVWGFIDNDPGGIPQPEVKLVIDARLARISGADDKVDVTELVRPRLATNETGPERLVRLGVSCCVPLGEVGGDAGQIGRASCRERV